MKPGICSIRPLPSIHLVRPHRRVSQPVRACTPAPADPPAATKPKPTPFAVLLGSATLFASLPTLVAMLLAHPFTLLLDRTRRRVHVSLALLWLRMSFALARVNVDVKGAENLPAGDGPILFVSNSLSTLDMFALASLRRGMRFMVPAGAKRAPFIGWVMAFAAWVGIGGSGRREQMKALQDATAVLGAGGSMCIFPEGGVSKNGKMKAFSAAAFRAAKKAGAVCVPVTVSGTREMFLLSDGENTSVVPTRRPSEGVKLVVHPSIACDELSEKDVAKQAESAVRSALPSDGH